MAVANLLSINSIKITHARTKNEWVVVINNQSNGYLEQLTFDESIFGTIPSGTLILRDPGDMIGDFNFTGKDLIEINITDRFGENIDLPFYYVYQAARATDYADRTQPRLVILKFIHESYFFNERLPFKFEEDIKDICKATPEGTFDGDNWVQKLFEQYFIDEEYNLSSTENYAWLKPRPMTYPSGRVVDHSKVLTLLNYLAENANTKKEEDKTRADFFFWKDLKSTNFISLGELIKEESKMDFGIQARDSLDTIDEKGRQKIDSVRFHPALSLMELENSGVFASYYERIAPNLSNPFFNYSDYGVGITKSNILFKIEEHFPEDIYKIYEKAPATQNPFEPGLVDNLIQGDQLNLEFYDTVVGTTMAAYTKRFYDDGKFGYFDSAFYNNSVYEPTYGFYTEQGVTAEEVMGHRQTQLMWQTMFDIEEFNPVVGQITTDPGGGLGDGGLDSGGGFPPELFTSSLEATDTIDKNIAKIYIDIKKTAAQKRATYLALRRIKEKWNIFKYVVCCLDANTSFWALITGASAIKGEGQTEPNTRAKAYRYSWQEVEFIPIRIAGVTLNGSTCTPTDQIAGTEICEACDVTCNGQTFGFEGAEYEYTESNPGFKVVSFQWGRSGGYTQGFEAFNINEVMNFENEDKKYAGPGTNLIADGYPLGTINQAIGNHPSKDDACVPLTHGQIVKMYQIEMHSIRGLTFCPTLLKRTPYLYLFDAQNDKEGPCIEC
jgi:hypothetical protein